MEVGDAYVFSEIADSPDFFISGNHKFICLTELSSLVFTNNTADSWNFIEVGELIKGVRLQNKGNFIAVATAGKILLIVDLLAKNVVLRFDGFYEIEHLRWSLDEENVFYMLRNDGVLERVGVVDSEWVGSKVVVPGIVLFDLVVGDCGSLVVFTGSGELKIVRDRSSVVVDRLDPSEVSSIRCIDSDIFCLQTISFLKFYSISEKFKPITVRKQILKFEPNSGVLLFTDHLSQSATIIPLSVFKVYKYEGVKFEINFIETQLELELIPKGSNKSLDLAVRHNNKVMIYPLTFEKALNPQEITTFSREAVNLVIENLSKKFEDCLKKLETAQMMTPTIENIQKSVCYSLDKHSEENYLNFTTALYTNFIDSFKSEILSSLTTQLETDMREVLNKFSLLFQDRLKFKVDRNNREEERSKKLAIHLKSCVVGFISLEEQVKKTVSKKNKTLTKFDIKLMENSEVLENTEAKPSLASLKAEIDSLLHKKKYEAAIIRSMQENNFSAVQGVLDVLSAKPLLDSHCISEKTTLQLFHFLLNNISLQSPEIFSWLEDLAKSLNSSDIQTNFSKIVDASFKYPQLNNLAIICSKRLEEGFKLEISTT